MRLSEIQTPVSSLPGVGPAMQKQFAALNVWTLCDLLLFFPRSYKDRTKKIQFKQFESAKEVHTVALVTGHEWFGYGRMKTLKILVRDSSASAELICFNRPFLEKAFPVGSIICVTGSFFVKYKALQSSAFEARLLSPGGTLAEFEGVPIPGSGIIPVYRLTSGLTQKKISKAVSAALAQCSGAIDNELPDEIRQKRSLLDYGGAIKEMHEPASFDRLERARRTLVYQELFDLQKAVLLRSLERKGALPQAEIGAAILDARKDGRGAVEESGGQKEAQDENALAAEERNGADFSPRQAALLERLPFALTKDQMAAIARMNRDIDKGFDERARLLKSADGRPPQKAPWTMQRLLQGDVGSGKTLVALFACLRIVDLGGQCAIMAPTEILAKQHAQTAADLLEPLGVRAAFLSGTISAAARSPLLKALKNGEIHILLGTHALFSKTTVYKDLQLVVIDEQHRFGVTQRQAIVEKGRALALGFGQEADGGEKNAAASSDSAFAKNAAAASAGQKKIYLSPHLLMMSATPIPQSLALTVYGDLDATVIKSLPAGRKPITTYLVAEGHEANAYGAVLKELQKGRQAYFVYPAIGGDGGATMLDAGGASGGGNLSLASASDEDGIKSAASAFENLSRNVFPQYACALLHSKIPQEEQERVLNDFRQNKIQVLAATTVVEVGVDVPNATCMVVEEADRFGLAQLHQLRGRVGRGSEQSYCFLIYRKDISQNGIERMKILRQSNDGFYIAEEDLKLRGPGQITGTAQSGALEFALADLNRDQDLLALARLDARASIESGAL